ncbi:MAG: hypothetical protein KKA84_01810 [Bacteroidetes bacterium]|nr:hypothetical protein [Bacteroidota bacterium]
MITEEEIEAIVKSKIERDEKLGEQSGGSGHFGYVSYKLNEIKTNVLPGDQLQIDYHYTTYIETEFTYEPDNPAYEYPHHISIIVNGEKEIIGEKEVFEESENTQYLYTDQDWEKAKMDVMNYVESFLAKIEWRYGDNRAPIKYPPELYELVSDEFEMEYGCMIEMDLGEDEKIYFKSGNPFELLNQIKAQFAKLFPSDVE